MHVKTRRVHTCAGEYGYVKTCAWTNDLDHVILEMPNESGKGTTDSDMSSLRSLLHEMEEEDVVDCTLNGHECARAPACGDTASMPESLVLSSGSVLTTSSLVPPTYVKTSLSWNSNLLPSFIARCRLLCHQAKAYTDLLPMDAPQPDKLMQICIGCKFVYGEGA